MTPVRLAATAAVMLGAVCAFVRAEEPALATPAEILERILELEDGRVIAGGELVGMLANPDATVRLHAARALGRIQDTGTVPALSPLLADPDEAVRMEAVFALGQLFDRRVAPVLEPLLATARGPLLAAVVLALGKSGDRNATAGVLSKLDDDDREVRSSVALACALLGDQNATVALCKRFTAELDPHVRWPIIYCLSRLDDARANPTLKAALGDQSLPQTRVWAAAGLRTATEDSQYAKALIESLGDPDERVIVSVLQVIARSPRAFGLSDIAGLAEHKSFHVRAKLAEAAVSLGGEGAADLLERLRSDSSVTVRAAATTGLARLLDRYALPMLAAAELDAAWQIRAAAVAGYAGIEGEKATAALLGLFRDANPAVQAAVVEAFGVRARAAGDELPATDEGLRTLLEALDVEDLAVRGTAVDALLLLKSPLAIKPLIQALEQWQGRDTYELRENVCRGLGELADPEALPVLELRLQDEYVSVRAAAATAIAAITGDSVPIYDLGGGPTDSPDAPPAPPVLPRGATPQVVIETTHGEILIDLHPDEAPRHVARFLQSVDRHLYDGLTIHRVVSNFVVQGGDPLGHGWGDAGYSLRDEINPRPYLVGSVGMPKAGKDTGGCQFFITLLHQPRLDGRYTVFGTVRVGMDVVNLLEVGDRIVTVRRLDAVSPPK